MRKPKRTAEFGSRPARHDINKRNLEIVERIRERVRSAPDTKLTLEMVASEEGLSATRMHQVFEAVQRESFGSYVRRAKLQYACGLMRAFRDWTCTRVAFEAGYSESSEFSRSFKREYGIAPSNWDRVRPLNRLGADTESKGNVGRSNDPKDICDSSFPDHAPSAATPVSIRTQAAQKVAVIAVPNAIDPANLAAAFDELEEFLTQSGQIRPGRRFVGLSYDSNLDTQPELIRFELAYPVDPDVGSEKDVLTRTLPQTTVAILPCRGGVKEFIAAWDYLLRGFLPSSQWGFGQGPHMEIYYNDPRRFGMAYWDMDCIIPVRRAGQDFDN